MDIMELGAIGELVGGVAVIGSLIFVGLQVRQNTRQMQLQTATAVAEQGSLPQATFAMFEEDVVANLLATWGSPMVARRQGQTRGDQRLPRPTYR